MEPSTPLTESAKTRFYLDKGGVSLKFKVDHLFECWFTLFLEKLERVLKNKNCGKLSQLYLVF